MFVLFLLLFFVFKFNLAQFQRKKMRSAVNETQVSNVFALFKEWDKGDQVVRKKFLAGFIEQNQNKTGPELEQEFAEGASLMLVRLTAWLRLTYMFGSALTEQLQSIEIFLSASGGHKFITEFIEVGGILTLLDIISLKQVTEINKAKALKCLQHIANSGRKYKELICESYGIRAIAECLAKSKCEETQEYCHEMLLALSKGNPKFEQQLYKGLIALLPCNSPKAQQIAVSSLRTVQPIVKIALPTIVPCLLGLLKTLHLDVQYEVVEFIKELMTYQVADVLLTGLVNLLSPNKKNSNVPKSLPDAIIKDLECPRPTYIYIQQASAAKIIGLLCKQNDDWAKKLLQLRIVPKLMCGLGNTNYADCQRHCSMTLEYLSRTYPDVATEVSEKLGDFLFQMLMSSPEVLYLNLSALQIEMLENIKVVKEIGEMETPKEKGP